MSTQPITEGTSQNPECRPTVRVFIDGTEVPIVADPRSGVEGVECQQRKTGPSDLSKVSWVTIPFEHLGYDILTEITGDEGATVADLSGMEVRIDLLDTFSDQYFLIHDGYIANAGPSTANGAFRILVGDWAAFYNRVGMNLVFNGQSPFTILRAVKDEMESHEAVPTIPFETNVPTVSVDNEGTLYFDDDRIIEGAALGLANFGATLLEGTEDLVSSTLGVQDEVDQDLQWDFAEAKTEFVDHEDSCADVLDWLADQLNARWYIDYSINNGPTLVFDSSINGPHLEGYNLSERTGEQDAVRVVENNMLFQLSPPHTYGARGERGPNTDGIPQVVVEHEKLVQRIGSNGHPIYHDVEATGLEQTISVAKSRLKRQIDDAAGGQSVCRPAPLARPYGSIELKPACGGRLARDVNPIRYEIEEVIHELSPPTVGTDSYPKTIIRGGVEVNESDLVVADKQILNT